MSGYHHNLPLAWYSRNEQVAPIDEVRKTLVALEKVKSSSVHHKLLQRRLARESDNPSSRTV